MNPAARRPPTHYDARYKLLARALGGFSLALGAAEVLWPRQLGRLIGAPSGRLTRSILQAFGVRELLAGAALLTNDDRPALWLRTRAAGDVLDLAALGVALGQSRAKPARLLGAVAAVGAVTGLDVLAAWRLGGVPQGLVSERTVRSACTVNRPLEEVYAFWRNIENLPQFMAHLESVKETGVTRSLWTVRGPAGIPVSWEAELTRDDTDHCIAWRSLPNADIDNAGEVRFTPAPGDQGTEVHIRLRYGAPGGAAGAALASLWGRAPEQQVASELRRFKEIMEAGEVLRSDASIHRGLHAARPPAAGANTLEVLQ